MRPKQISEIKNQETCQCFLQYNIETKILQHLKLYPPEQTIISKPLREKCMQLGENSLKSYSSEGKNYFVRWCIKRVNISLDYHKYQ